MAVKERKTEYRFSFPTSYFYPSMQDAKTGNDLVFNGKQRTVSSGHPYDRQRGRYVGGGPFYTSLIEYGISPSHVTNAWKSGSPQRIYSGPVYPTLPSPTEIEALGDKGNPQFGSETPPKDTDGATAISLCSPVNPASKLGTTLAETFREGIPSLPGIQSWKRRTEILKGLGSEYLNYQFGWAPLMDEVVSVRDAARKHRDIMKNYRHNEGRNTHRGFSFPSDTEVSTITSPGGSATFSGFNTGFIYTGGGVTPTRTVTKEKVTKRWFEGLFTYALPSSSDSWRKAIGFGSDADQLFGLTLTPDVLWELTPWSWAVDWFSNAGDVINNVTNFGLAGQVMRYGYMMEETIVTYHVSLDHANLKTLGETKPGGSKGCSVANGGSSFIRIRTKKRAEANPFGFGLTWEGLSPTQLAITAALGITKLL